MPSFVFVQVRATILEEQVTPIQTPQPNHSSCGRGLHLSYTHFGKQLIAEHNRVLPAFEVMMIDEFNQGSKQL